MIARVYRVLHILSIDIVIGAVSLLHFFCTYYSVQVTWPVYVLLANTVWVIYTYDHLSDAAKAIAPLRERYAFHLRYKTKLKFACLIVAVSCIPLLFLLEPKVVLWGVVLASCSLIYLLLQSRVSVFKEVYVALIYTLGILFVPFIHLGRVEWLGFALLFLLALTNLSIFSFIDIQEDRKDKFNSMATRLGLDVLYRLIIVCLSIGFSMSLLVFGINSILVFFIIAFSIYFIIVYFFNQPYKTGVVRIVCDGVFITSGLFTL